MKFVLLNVLKGESSMHYKTEKIGVIGVLRESFMKIVDKDKFVDEKKLCIITREL